MKRLLAAFAAVLCVAILFTGCAKKEQKVTVKAKVGLVFDLAGRGDNSFNDSAYNGLVMIAQNYKGWIEGTNNPNFGKDVQIKYAEPKTGGQDRETLMRALAQEGYNPIYGIGFAFADSIAKVAKDFPKTQFVGIDVFVDGLTATSNITCVAFKENEGSFLVGAIAALKGGGKKVGFLGGVDIALIHRFDNGFKAGAMYVNAAYRAKDMILSQYISKEFTGFNDPKGGYDISMNLFKQGCSIIYAAAGGSGDGMFKAAMETKNLGIGVDSDQALVYNTATDAAVKDRAKVVLTSMLKRVDMGVYSTAKEFIDKGKLAGGYRTLSLADEGVGYAENDLNKAQLADVKTQIEDLKKKIVGGEIKVPDENTDMAAWAKTLK
jgi:basic membrane protein A and related proteins